jgi:hypothetical protein
VIKRHDSLAVRLSTVQGVLFRVMLDNGALALESRRFKQEPLAGYSFILGAFRSQSPSPCAASCCGGGLSVGIASGVLDLATDFVTFFGGGGLGIAFAFDDRLKSPLNFSHIDFTTPFFSGRGID